MMNQRFLKINFKMRIRFHVNFKCSLLSPRSFAIILIEMRTSNFDLWTYNGVKFNICRLLRNIEILSSLHLAYKKQNCSENVVVNIEICEKRLLPPSLTTHTSQLFYTLS